MRHRLKNRDHVSVHPLTNGSSIIYWVLAGCWDSRWKDVALPLRRTESLVWLQHLTQSSGRCDGAHTKCSGNVGERISIFLRFVFVSPTHLHVKVLFNKWKEESLCVPLSTSFSANMHSLLSLPLRCLKRSICPSGALAASRGERISSVLSCKQSVHFWFGNFSEPFKWLLSWPCQLQGKKYLWSSSKFTEAFQIFQGSLPN